MVQRTSITKDTPPREIKRDIQQTRNEMSGTIDEIEERFSTAHWKSVARETVREKMDIAASRSKALADRVKVSAQEWGRQAGDRSSRVGNQVLQFIKDDPAAVWIAAFELGAWIVILTKLYLDTRSAGNPEGSEYATAKVMPIEEVEEKVRQAALAPEQGMRKAA